MVDGKLASEEENAEVKQWNDVTRRRKDDVECIEKDFKGWEAGKQRRKCRGRLIIQTVE